MKERQHPFFQRMEPRIVPFIVERENFFFLAGEALVCRQLSKAAAKESGSSVKAVRVSELFTKMELA